MGEGWTHKFWMKTYLDSNSQFVTEWVAIEWLGYFYETPLPLPFSKMGLTVFESDSCAKKYMKLFFRSITGMQLVFNKYIYYYIYKCIY